MSSKTVKVLRLTLVVVMIGVLAVIGGGLGAVYGIIKSLPNVSEIDLKPTGNYTAFLYDQDGVEFDRLSSGEDRIYAELDQIPLYLQQAVIATEDERFYEHSGIDIKGIARALVANIKSGEFSQGASTITQQLVKNNVLTSQKKITRKIQEQYLAIQFERQYAKEYGEKEGKDLILEYYLNTMPLGRGTNGVQAAANRYYGKDVSELSLAESVVLAGITQAPTKFDPIKNPENNYEKSKVILQKMIDQGYITEEEKEQALKENPYKTIYEFNETYQATSTHSYFVDALIEEILTDLQQEKGLTEVQANKLLFEGGLQIYTTFDSGVQTIVDTYMSDDSLYPTKDYELKLAYTVSVRKEDDTLANLYAEGIVKNEKEIEDFKKAQKEKWGLTETDNIESENILKIPQPQSAFVIADHTTGQVKAMSGGRGEKESDRTFNRATQAVRQPGSIFKVLSTYAPALEEGIASPGSILMDEPIEIPLPSGNYKPKNWDHKYRGPVSVRQAIWHSINTVTVKTLDNLGVDKAYDYLLKFGFTTLKPSDRVYSLALGGLTEGVTPLELNAAMGVIANGGVYIEPTLYTKILDREGNVVLEKVPKTYRVLSPSTAYMLTDIMEDVINVGTGGSIKSYWGGMPIAGKTGTTNDDKDFLFAGYTPYYTATVWLGHDQPKRVKATGREHLKIWAKIMNDVHSGLPYKGFEKVTTGYTYASLCRVSGQLATELCSLDKEHKVISDYFLTREVPNTYCEQHVGVHTCRVSGKIATQFCPPEDVRITPGIVGESPEDLCPIHTAFVKPEEPEEPEEPDGPINPEEPEEPQEPVGPTEPESPIEPTLPEN